MIDVVHLCDSIRRLRPESRPTTADLREVTRQVKALTADLDRAKLSDEERTAVRDAEEHATWGRPEDWLPEQFIAAFKTLEGVRTWTNERGNTILAVTFEDGGGSRYAYDFDVCTPRRGWQQWDTKQDASYFGVWVHPQGRLTLTFAEDDLSLVICPTADMFRAEIASMEDLYGANPPSAVGLDIDTGQRTEYYEHRLSATDIT